LGIVTDGSWIVSATSIGARRKASGIIGVVNISHGTGAKNTVSTFAVLQEGAS